MSDIKQLAETLIARLESYGSVAIAFSGGVDSSVVAAAACRSSIVEPIAITGRSPSVATWQLEMAIRVAHEIGIEHRIVSTAEGEDPNYIQNDSRRCFHCKHNLYQVLETICCDEIDRVIVSGTNADDLGDYRPGIEAGRIANVRTPLADLGIGKAHVRALAKFFGLSNHDVPASPCLASRIAYGVDVTPDRLKKIEAGELWLRQQGFSDCRVRVHENDLARIEVPVSEVSLLTGSDLGGRLVNDFRELGFRYITIDLAGLRSGSMNESLVSIQHNQISG